ncbi:MULTISPECIES: hypothetical protein [unclassified Streptomyces]|uniref:hypothetical protein n=1 Tax=unclassified Streptomyces TaxID=2593676 RepID=UPI0035DCF370
MKARTTQLTLCWFLLLWRGGSRFAVGPLRRYDQGRTRTVGATVSICRLTIGLARLGPTITPGVDAWWRDFGGRRVGLWSVGGWRTGFPILFSTGWMRSGGRWPCGFTVTVAARTVCVAYLCSGAHYRTFANPTRGRKVWR